MSKPADPADFNGTVFVEWFNVTAGFDNAPDWLMAHNQIVREGAAWVGVSAQAVGVEGGDGLDVAIALPPLKEADPERYGTLDHPGDAFSYDIFTQAGAGVRGEGDGAGLLDGYEVEHLIAMGESQSAWAGLAGGVDSGWPERSRPGRGSGDASSMHTVPSGVAVGVGQPTPTDSSRLTVM